jgi:hypothetical protein
MPADARYDARIALARRVPTRERSWHDVANALVWATFPRTKLALHVRQHALVRARLGRDLRLPGSRTREHDALAMFDEGGAALLCARGRRRDVDRAVDRDATEELVLLIEERASTLLVFGHAIYEALARGSSASLRCLARVIEVDRVPSRERGCVRAVDESLAALLSRSGVLGREDFASFPIDERLAGSARCRPNGGVATGQHPGSTT